MKIYCSGIGGIGLSAYASLQQAAGHEVLGSDRAPSVVTDDLQASGIQVFFDQDGSAMPDDINLFVYSQAIPPDAPERVKAKELGVQRNSYFQALGHLSKQYKVIAVAGTHGKSSTTSMAAKMLIDAGLDPTIVVGTRVADLDGRNWRKGESDIFLLEACEYRRSFHFIWPSIVLLTNVDGDHFDAYDSVEEYQEAFVQFLQLLKPNSPVITHGTDPECVDVVGQSKGAIIDADTYPLPDLQVPGAHMQQNAQLCLALADHLGIEQQVAQTALQDYKGCWRRMEHKGTTDSGAVVIDDYAHHPKEITASLEGLKAAYPDKRIVCVYQPHTHDRTLHFYKEFTESFSSADELIFTDVYEARKDIETDRVDMEDFVQQTKQNSSVDVRFGGDIHAIEILLREQLTDNDLCICMGAGTITQLAAKLVE